MSKFLTASLRWSLLSLVVIATAQAQPVRRTVSVLRGAETSKITFNMPQVQVMNFVQSGQNVSEVFVPGVNSMSHVGLPKLPFYSFVVIGRASDITVTSNLGPAQELKVNRLAPCAAQKLRCSAAPLRFENRVKQYADNQALYHIESLGDYRGLPMQRVTILPHYYDMANGKLSIYPKAEFQVVLKNNGTSNFRAVYLSSLARRRSTAYDYLIVTPAAFKDALKPWMDFKTQSQQLRFKVLEVESVGRSPEGIQKAIKAEYDANKFTYALIVGNQNLVPNFRMSTTTTASTPTDLPYFAMGGVDDFIPDVFAGRMVAATADDVKHQTQKWMDYEKSDGRAAGWGHGVGIASNQGSGPSDEEYVRSMEKALTDKYQTQFLHFAETDKANSNPKMFNNALNGGAMYAVYVGHGSGTSWPSFADEYSVKDIKSLQNASAVKPVWIDVACQNGRLERGMAGERMSNEVDANGAPIGTTAYYGGSVNISWHPPAILARGITMKMAEQETPILGAVIQMGHAYLAEQISDVKEIRSNQIWYHLQGDPSLRLHVKSARRL
ncbi:MAG: hypothetical protein JST80_13830 [Bdellovibrionales bacterium]|nr:hypothetical protein [Bdellovibrionales bacterium]